MSKVPYTKAATTLHSIVYLRNVCAHHSRFWNRAMSISPFFPLAPRKIWLSNTNIKNNRTYFMLCMLLYLLQTGKPNTNFPAKLKVLFEKYPNVDLKAMDFPKNWEAEQLWQ